MEFMINVNEDSFKVCRKAFVKFHGFSIYEFEQMGVAVKKSYTSRSINTRSFKDDNVLEYNAEQTK